ncbi:MAG: helix-turn-helix domain containing protein [Chloroflexota bacterium]|nr:helix-turn-helix domain containing protein [Chloroflexota bacterium]
MLPTDTDKVAALRVQHALNPQPQSVTDPNFTASSPFFDARDLVQVKYEMLRRVHHDGQTVSAVAASFGFSRPSFYEAQAALRASGLPGLLPQRRGPRRAHKLSTEVVAAVQAARERDPSLTTPQLVELVRERFGLSVHRRSIERALARAKTPWRP